MSTDADVLRVTARDLELGDEQTVDVKSGDYVVICTEPAHIDSVQKHANGTVVVTIKGLSR